MLFITFGKGPRPERPNRRGKVIHVGWPPKKLAPFMEKFERTSVGLGLTKSHAQLVDSLRMPPKNMAPEKMPAFVAGVTRKMLQSNVNYYVALLSFARGQAAPPVVIEMIERKIVEFGQDLRNAQGWEPGP